MCVLALLLEWVARVWVESGVSALAHHVCGVGANHIKGLAKLREVHCLQCVRQGEYPVLTPCFYPYPASEPRADPEPEDQGQTAEPRPAGTVSLGAQGSGSAG